MLKIMAALAVSAFMLSPAQAQEKPKYTYAPFKQCSWTVDNISTFGACTGTDGEKTPHRMRRTSKGLEMMPDPKKGGKPKPIETSGGY